MRKLVAFNQVTMDGYFAGINGDISWAHKDNKDAEWNAFVADNANAGGLLLFGRVTYELMASYWPTPMALESAPVVAERMNNLPKVVFSRTLDRASWNNTKLVKVCRNARRESCDHQSIPSMVHQSRGSKARPVSITRLAPAALPPHSAERLSLSGGGSF